jgi:tetratricopeptide (TPR) repeat protein
MMNLLARRVAGFFLLLLLSACAAPQTRQLQTQSPAGLPLQFELTQVPFFPQEAYQCGPAALATVLTVAGFSIQPDALVQQVYLPERQGSAQVEMLTAARRNGALAYQLAPQLDDLLQEIAAGNPVLVMQNLALSWYPKWHYAVVVGYDIPRSEMILRSGLEQRQVLSMATFEHTWARSERWAVVVLPPGKLPVTAKRDASLKAAAALEKNVQSQAGRTYSALLEQWPNDLVALMGAGNTAYANKDLAAAENYFRRAIQYHPASGDAWNNLAQTLADQERFYEAHYAAKKALPLGGPNLEQYRQTLSAIEIKLHIPR